MSEIAEHHDDNPDYCGPEGNRLRSEANKFGDERHKLMDEAHKAFEAGDKARAKELSDQGKEAGKKMEEMHKKAAEVILKHRNDGHPDTYLDLHGLLLEEALEAFRERIKQLQSAHRGQIEFELIPGAGHHSKGKAVIKPKVMEELTKMKLPFFEKNAGTLIVTMESGPAADQNTTPENATQPPEPPSAAENKADTPAAAPATAPAKKEKVTTNAAAAAVEESTSGVSKGTDPDVVSCNECCIVM